MYFYFEERYIVINKVIFWLYRYIQKQVFIIIIKLYIYLYFPEHISSIIGSMLRNCQSTQRQRLFNKFIENDHEKVKL